MTATKQNAKQADTASLLQENSMLVAQLAALGVYHLRAVTVVVESVVPVTPSNLIAALARHPDARFREALIPLFLRQPQLASDVPALVETLDDSTADVLKHMYTSAVYLQRSWRGTLGIYLGEFPLLPNYFGQVDFGLPSPDEYFGEVGLRSLADYYRKKNGYNWQSTYASVMSLFLKQLGLEGAKHVQPVY